MKAINLSIFDATPAMRDAGVFESARKDRIEALQSFWLDPEPPSRAVLWSHAEMLAFIAKSEGADHAVVDCAPYFVEILSEALKDQDLIPITPFYHDDGTGDDFSGWILI